LNVGEFGEYLMAEKIFYLVCAGPCVLLALLTIEFENKKALVYTALSCLVLFHSITTFSRSAYWKDTRTYLVEALEFAPDFYLDIYVPGNQYAKSQEYEKALVEFRRAAYANPHLSLAYNNIGNIYYLSQDFDRAIGAWQQPIKSDPDSPAHLI
jgi:tetratricopeptide (TPR) repeat protein